MVDREAQVGTAEQDQSSRRLGLGRDRLLERVGEHSKTFGRQLDQQGLPVREVMSGGRVGDAEPTGEGAGGDGSDAFLVDDLERLVDERALEIAVMVVTGAFAESAAGHALTLATDLDSGKTDLYLHLDTAKISRGGRVHANSHS